MSQLPHVLNPCITLVLSLASLPALLGARSQHHQLLDHLPGTHSPTTAGQGVNT